MLAERDASVFAKLHLSRESPRSEANKSLDFLQPPPRLATANVFFRALTRATVAFMNNAG
jgi:hypothetical protein